MSILDILVAEIDYFIDNPISILTILLPCLLGIFLLIKLFDFIFIYFVLRKIFDDDKEKKKDV